MSVLLLTTSKLLLLIFFNCSENKLTLVYWRSLRWGCFRELNAANLEETVLSRMVDDLCELQGRRRVFAALFPALKKGVSEGRFKPDEVRQALLPKTPLFVSSAPTARRKTLNRQRWKHMSSFKISRDASAASERVKNKNSSVRLVLFRDGSAPALFRTVGFCA